MGWARLDDGFHDHPKLIGLSLESLGLWTKCLTWAHRHHGGSAVLGHIPEGLPATFAGSRSRRLTAELVDHRLWDPEYELGGWVIHDYVDFLPAAEKPESAGEVSKARSEAGKRGAEARWGSKASTGQPDSKLPSAGYRDSMPPTRPDQIAMETPPVSPVPETAATDDDESNRVGPGYWSGLGISNPGRIQALLVQHVDRPLTERQTLDIVLGILTNAKQKPRSPQAYVERSVEQSWAEIQRDIDEGRTAA